MSRSLINRVCVPAVLTLMALGATSTTAQAQDDKIYAIADVQNPPKLSSSALAAKLIQESYPADLKSRGVGGMVELQFVVDAKERWKVARSKSSTRPKRRWVRRPRRW